MANLVAANIIKASIEHIERLETEAAEVAESIKEAYASAKSQGIDAKVLKAAIAQRRKDPAAASEAASLLDLYLEAAR